MPLFRRSATAALVALLLATLTVPNARAVTIDMVTVGNPGNIGDTQTYLGYGTLTFGAVDYEYRIGKYHVTIQQYTDFLNATAKSDPYSLYGPSMVNSEVAGISRSGISGEYTYSVIGPFGTNPPGASSPGNRPITCVSWFDAARFANWMHNGQGSGSTETGAYTLNGVVPEHGTPAPAKNPGAKFYIPTENEWYKAAYYSPVKGGPGSPGYYAYATQSDTAPGNNIGSWANQANYQSNSGFSVTQSSHRVNQNFLTDVGAFTNSASFYGTFDQSGNVLQWNDLDGTDGSRRGVRGGSWLSTASGLSSSWRNSGIPAYDSDYGFRLASPVPEPSTWVMVAGGVACASWSAWRRRKAAA